jgi:hypothetical protein
LEDRSKVVIAVMALVQYPEVEIDFGERTKPDMGGHQ